MRTLLQNIAWIVAFPVMLHFYIPTLVSFHKSEHKNNEDFNDLAHDLVYGSAITLIVMFSIFGISFIFPDSL